MIICLVQEAVIFTAFYYLFFSLCSSLVSTFSISLRSSLFQVFTLQYWIDILNFQLICFLFFVWMKYAPKVSQLWIAGNYRINCRCNSCSELLALGQLTSRGQVGRHAARCPPRLGLRHSLFRHKYFTVREKNSYCFTHFCDLYYVNSVYEFINRS